MSLEEESLFAVLLSKHKDKTEEITVGRRRGFLKKVALMDAAGQERMYKLILLFSCHTTKQDTLSHGLPFDAMRENESSRNVIFGFRNFPYTLQHILVEFADLHTKRMNCDKTKSDSMVRALANTATSAAALSSGGGDMDVSP